MAYASGLVSVILLSGCAIFKQATRTPPLPDFDLAKWEIVACASFDTAETSGTSFRWNFPGMSWSITNGVATVQGTSQTNKWCGTRVTLPIAGDTADLVEVSGEFKLEEYEGYHLTALFGQEQTSGKEPLCMFFEGRDGKGHYRIQTRWMKQSSELLNGSYGTAGTGEETKRFHKMKMILDRARSCIFYYVDERHLGTIQVDGSVEPIKVIEMDFESPEAGNTTKILYDNLLVRRGTW